ncbi:MAG: efflux RND transporter periplasmic adaptor subunit [Rhodospirillales bacterium]|nr:efflux RND transporter periplasmic adaptor subunit [Rhodospirillales bacterium]MCB9997302.1 efflux RND transporter periplasmic adaptor subunit [Rhodospirillales bacterium]
MKKSYLIALSIAVIAVLWVASGIIAPASETTDQPAVEAKAAGGEDKALAEVRVRESTAESVTGDVKVTGRTGASRQVVIKAEIAGRVTEIVLEEGTPVTEGQVIAHLEKRDREARTAEARQRLSQREIEYNAAKSLENKGLNSKVRLAQAKADMEEARAILKQAEIDFENTEITAPFDGILYDQVIETGDYVTAGDPLFSIVDLDPIAVRGFVTEQQVINLVPGGKAMADFLGSGSLEGTITYISPAADPETRTFAIEISIPNPAQKIIAGMTAQLRIPTAAHPAHKISPSVLSLNDEGRVGVKFVDENDTVQFSPVAILGDYPDYMLVGGLPDKVRLITVGQDFVVPGQHVKPVPAEGDGLL